MEENISQQSENTQTSPSALSNSDLKSKLPLVSAVLLLLVLIGAAGFFLGKSLGQPKTSPPSISQVSPTPTPENPIPTPTPDPTANWKTYINSLNRYSLKYPSDQQVKFDTLDPYIGICGLGKSDISILLYPPDKNVSVIDPEFSGNLALTIKTINNSGKYSIQEWVNKNCQGTWLVINANQEKIIIKEASEAIKYTGAEFKNTSLVVISKDDKLFFIYAYSGNPNYQISQTLDLILSTFKFLD